jgi:DNA-binding transcriptional MerR regulator/quercetin dioxygenase-like cupin family protein
MLPIDSRRIARKLSGVHEQIEKSIARCHMRKKTPSRRRKRVRASNSNRSKNRNSIAGFLTVGQTARILGISPSTLRQWENVGLVAPVRSQGRFRLYSPEVLELLKRIKYLRDVKQLRVPGIKRVLDETRSRKAPTRTGKTPSIGEKLRTLRKRSGLGVAEVARRAKISGGFLSAIELSQANPSVATLQRLANVYNTTVLEFYDLPHKPSAIMKPSMRPLLRTESGVAMELLSTGTKMLQSMLFRVPPGSGSDGAYSHNGEEFIYMLNGTLEIWLDELECHVLHEGESFWFESTRGHRWFNSGDRETVLLWVNTPPTF